MIIDCFPFFNELELLEIRLEELKDVVDWFVLVEAGETHSGKPKTLAFEANQARFAEYNIVHLTIDSFPPVLSGSWAREEYARNTLRDGVNALDPSPMDVVMLSDVDEIPRAEEVRRQAARVSAGEVGCCVFEQDLCYYYVNRQSNEPWGGTRMTRFDRLETFQALRARDGTHIAHGGWHFGYLGGVERVIEKIGASVHTELDRPEHKQPDRLAECIASGADLFGRHYEFTYRELDDSFPRYLLANREKFAHLIAPPPGVVEEPAAEVKLDIGSGGSSSLGQDWTGVDAYVTSADVCAEMWELPYADASVSEIYSCHALEHVPMKLVAPTLAEWSRVLAPAGRLTLLVPDLAWCMIQWLAAPTTGFEMMRIFGNQEHEGEYHKSGFNAGILQEQLSRAGFDEISIEAIWSHQQQTLKATAVKR